MSDKRLRTVAVPHPQATILDFKVAPGFRGHEDENLLCGECSLVLLAGVSEQFMGLEQARCRESDSVAHSEEGPVGSIRI